MQILCRSCGGRPDLKRWLDRRLWESFRERTDGLVRNQEHRRIVGQELPGEPETDGLFRRLESAILRYDIFPHKLVTPILLRTPLEIGETVGTCYHLIPGIDLFFASRVIERIDGEESGVWRAGFTYSTLEGHPVMGAETFLVEKDLRTGTVSVSLRSWSQPVTWLARCFRGLCRHLQRQAVKAALEHLQNIAAG